MMGWILRKDPKSDGFRLSNDHYESVEIHAHLMALRVLSKNGCSNTLAGYEALGIDVLPILMEEIHNHALAVNDFIQKSFPSLNNSTRESGQMLEGMMNKFSDKCCAAASKALSGETFHHQEYSSSNEQECHYESCHSLSSSSQATIYDRDDEDDADDTETSRRLFHKEEEEEIGWDVSENSSLARNEQEHFEVEAATGSNLLCNDTNDGITTSFNDTTLVVSQSLCPAVLPNPSLSLKTNVRLQFVEDLNIAAPDLTKHIDNVKEKNSAYLQKQSELDEGCFLYAKFDSCTPLIYVIISTLKRNGDLKSFLSCMKAYASVVAPNMEIFAGVRGQMKQRVNLLEAKANEIVTFNTKDPLSFAAKAFAENEIINGDRTVSLSSREVAAVDAYNIYAGRDHDQLPSACAVLSHKEKNASSVSLSLMMAARVANLIKICEVHSRVEPVNFEREQQLKSLFVLGKIIKPDLSKEDILNMSLHQYFVDILYPTTDLSTEKLFEPISISTDESQTLLSIIIQISRFLKDEMSERKFIDNFKKSESCSLVEDMDELHPDEIQQRCDEMMDEDYYFCARGKKGNVLSYRRQACGAILFSLLNAKILVKMLKRVGFEENTIDAFLFGLLSNATSNFVRKAGNGKEKKIPFAFLFDETNYRRYEMDSNIEDVKEFIDDNITPVINTAAKAIKDFEKKTHFSEKSDTTPFREYLDHINDS